MVVIAYKDRSGFLLYLSMCDFVFSSACQVFDVMPVAYCSLFFLGQVACFQLHYKNVMDLFEKPVIYTESRLDVLLQIVM